MNTLPAFLAIAVSFHALVFGLILTLDRVERRVVGEPELGRSALPSTRPDQAAGGHPDLTAAASPPNLMPPAHPPVSPAEPAAQPLSEPPLFPVAAVVGPAGG